MAGETNPVRVVIEIVDNFSDELAELEAKLDKLDAKAIDVDLDIEDNGDIDSTRAQLDSLEEIINAILDIDTIGEGQAMAIKQMLERDMHSTLHVDTERDLGVGSGDFAPDEIRSIFGTDGRGEEFWPDGTFRADPGDAFPAGTRGFTDPDFLEAMQEVNMESIDRAVASARGVRGDFGASRRLFNARGVPEIDAPRFPEDSLPGGRGVAADFGFDFDFGGSGGLFSLPDDIGADEATQGLRRMAKALDNLRPSLRTFTNIVALGLPLLISLAGAAVGLAAALGAVGTGLAAIVGVGLLGWGDSATQSLKNVRKAAVETGKDILNVFQPLGNQFQPVLEDWLAGAPNLARQLVDPLERMLVFADDLEAMGQGLVEWTVDVLNVMASMEKQAVSVAQRAGSAFGSFIIDALSAMLREVNRNQDAYVKIGSILVDFAVILFNVFKTITFVVANFKAFFDVLAAATNILGGKVASSFLTFIAILFVAEAALLAMSASLGVLQGGLLATAAAALSSYVPHVTKAITITWQFVAAANSLAGALLRVAAVSGVGLLLAAAGSAAVGQLSQGVQSRVSRSTTPQAGTNNTIINVEGDVGRREADRILDEVGPTAQNEMSISAARQK
jgi:hypothetical protein